MTNTLYLPELREMLAEDDTQGLTDFCTALHPARTAEFMEGLTAAEAWSILQHAELPLRVEIFGFFDQQRQVEIIETLDRAEIASFVGDLPPDDRVDLLQDAQPAVVNELMPLIPTDERRDIQRLSAYPEDTAGAVMTTQFARLSEDMPVGTALEEIGQQAADLETIYYLYVVDQEDHLRGVVSARQLVSAMGRPEALIDHLMERDLVTVNVADDQEVVADKVARYNLSAIPVVDDEHHMLGIITHDDVIDVVREEATEDAHRIAAVAPLDEGYLQTGVFTLTRKRGIWLTILFLGALLTAVALQRYQSDLMSPHLKWLIVFIPLVISTGGNSGSQSATLVITALSTGDVLLRDWWHVARRELTMGLLLGGFLGAIGYFCALLVAPDPALLTATVIPITLLLVVIWGTLTGSLLPLLFRRLGWDPALMSNPFVAGLVDVAGINIFMQVAIVVHLALGKP
jgi:magnesium transporter